MKYFLSLVALILTVQTLAQDSVTLPYYEIPSYPESYTAGNVMGRLIDGLGFRYYWATEGLREQDLAFKPSAEGRSVEETIDHIYGLSLTIVNATMSRVNVPTSREGMEFTEMRRQTLLNFQKASAALKAGAANDMESYRVIFNRGGNQSEYPFWNMINGPIADAIYHTGQVVTLRRTSGNPINPNISQFNGRLRE